MSSDPPRRSARVRMFVSPRPLPSRSDSRNPRAVVGHLDHHFLVAVAQRQLDGPGLRVLVDVGERLLQRRDTFRSRRSAAMACARLPQRREPGCRRSPRTPAPESRRGRADPRDPSITGVRSNSRFRVSISVWRASRGERVEPARKRGVAILALERRRVRLEVEHEHVDALRHAVVNLL